MFAPYCPTCRNRMLLGTRRIVRIAWGGTADPCVVLRCFCGTLVHADEQPPAAGSEQAHQPAAEVPEQQPGGTREPGQVDVGGHR
ncbi:hypothetical protein H0B56_03160 [Haloechinothrix sp. YIM 98757]|uniref:Uncharacterized protein n=1 Tax=Haloechinothrix aidingensis TaxID=2752311 RepID=A0A838A0C9_9PSEU|nr:hypothetical protein [Haloechinothrix aidingensis]MBA0124533.1 hypothetical protein [Haloechinothrix aidingensis]